MGHQRSRDRYAALAPCPARVGRWTALLTAVLLLSPTGCSSAVELPVVLLAEDFDDDDNGWGTGEGLRLEAGAYIVAPPPGQRVARAADVLIAQESTIDRSRTTMDFTATNAAFVGVECAYEASGGTSRWYLLRVGVDGSRIERQPFGQGADVTTLAEDRSVVLTDGPMSPQAPCLRSDEDYRLALAVNGRTVLEATDPEPFGSGAPGLVVQAAPASERGDGAEVRIDRFVVTGPDGTADGR